MRIRIEDFDLFTKDAYTEIKKLKQILDGDNTIVLELTTSTDLNNTLCQLTRAFTIESPQSVDAYHYFLGTTRTRFSEEILTMNLYKRDLKEAE